MTKILLSIATGLKEGLNISDGDVLSDFGLGKSESESGLLLFAELPKTLSSTLVAGVSMAILYLLDPSSRSTVPEVDLRGLLLDCL